MNFARCVWERNNLRLNASNKAGPLSALLLSLIRSDCASYRSVEQDIELARLWKYIARRKEREKISSIVGAYLERITDKPTFVCSFAFLCCESRIAKLSRPCGRLKIFFIAFPIYTFSKYDIRRENLCAFLQLYDLQFYRNMFWEFYRFFLM